MKKKQRITSIYYLHNKMKEFGFKVDGPKREIDVHPYIKLYDIPVGPRYYVQQLIRQGYNIQLKLF